MEVEWESQVMHAILAEAADLGIKATGTGIDVYIPALRLVSVAWHQGAQRYSFIIPHVKEKRPKIKWIREMARVRFQYILSHCPEEF